MVSQKQPYFHIDSEYKKASKKLILDYKKERFIFIKKEALNWKKKPQTSSVWR